MTNAHSHHGRSGAAVRRLLIVLAAIALVVAPVLVIESPREVARWYLAAAEEAMLDEDYVSAVARLDKAIAWNDSDPWLYLRRADCKLKTRQWASGLDDCDRARQLAPDNLDIGEKRSQFLMHLNRHESAIAEQKQLLREKASATPGERAELLNALAYARAVGKRELREGLEAVNESLKIAGTRAGILDPLGYLCFNRGFTAISQGENDVALESLDEALRSAKTIYQQTVDRYKVLENLPRGQGEYAERVRVLRSHLAGILKLRALLLEDLEQPEKAARDRKQLDELASNGNLAISKPIDLRAAFPRLQGSSNMLDTRGFLHYQLGDLPAARRDMQRAIAIIDVLCANFRWQMEALRHQVVDMRPVTAQQSAMLWGKAVMYYHQMLVHEALGMDEAAARDRGEVIELGYEPNEQLL